MNLNEAIASGRLFSRASNVDTDGYYTAEDFLNDGISLEEFNALDYVLEPDAPLATIAMSLLSTAWNDAKGSTTAVKVASESEMFKRLVIRLRGLGINVEG